MKSLFSLQTFHRPEVTTVPKPQSSYFSHSSLSPNQLTHLCLSPFSTLHRRRPHQPQPSNSRTFLFPLSLTPTTVELTQTFTQAFINRSHSSIEAGTVELFEPVDWNQKSIEPQDLLELSFPLIYFIYHIYKERKKQTLIQNTQS